MAVIPREAPATLLTVCERGYGKRTPTSDYPTKNRGGKGVITIKTSERNGKVVNLRIVTFEHDARGALAGLWVVSEHHCRSNVRRHPD
jgi:DNA gyrase subunit A